MKKEELNSATLHVIRDQQGKLYIAAKVSFGWLSVEHVPILYGYKDLGTVEQICVKLAQYQHAARVLRTSVQNQFLQALELFKEAEK